jgi:hypothetical protein
MTTDPTDAHNSAQTYHDRGESGVISTEVVNEDDEAHVYREHSWKSARDHKKLLGTELGPKRHRS